MVPVTLILFVFGITLLSIVLEENGVPLNFPNLAQVVIGKLMLLSAGYIAGTGVL